MNDIDIAHEGSDVHDWQLVLIRMRLLYLLGVSCDRAAVCLVSSCQFLVCHLRRHFHSGIVPLLEGHSLLLYYKALLILLLELPISLEVLHVQV